MTAAPRNAWQKLALALAALLPLLYVIRITGDSIAGLFGVYWMDEALYLLTAKNQVLFGEPHPFPQDVWLPEIRVPLLHLFALLTYSKTHLLLFLRLGMAVCIMSGAAIIARLARIYHNDINYGIACFICILLNPILFFYARLGLAEGIQFLLLAFILTSLYRLSTASDSRDGIMHASICGSLAGLLLVSKISAIALCIGLGIGFLLAIYRNVNLPRKHAALAACIGSGAIVIALYFFAYVGMTSWDQWWHVNMAGSQAIGQTPTTLKKAAEIFFIKWFDISYFIAMMPIFALYFLSLTQGVDRSKGFIYILAAITITTVFLESFYGSSVRRNFFSLAMMSITFGFLCVDYIKYGKGAPTKAEKLRILGRILLILQGLGTVCLLLFSVKVEDPIYCVLAIVFLLILLISAGTTGPRYALARRLLVALVIPCSLFPMVFEDFFTPNTRHEADVIMENQVAEDGIVAGVRAPVYFQGRRRSVFTNCLAGNVPVDFTNDIGPVAALGKSYYITNVPIELDPCAPGGGKGYKLINVFDIFDPENAGIVGVVKGNGWQYEKRFAIYGKAS